MTERIESGRLATHESSTYEVRLVRNAEEVRAAQELRFSVFNLELHEGLEESYLSGLDTDPFDEVCNHLIVRNTSSGEVVGTYRLQTGRNAALHKGYYSAQGFDLSPFEPVRDQLIELGRACVHKSHRNLLVLGLLWRGIAQYAVERGGRYLIGCSSLTSQDETVGASAYADMSRNNLIASQFRTAPVPGWACSLDRLASEPVRNPKLLRAYLSIGAGICGPPSIDRGFKTIDFLTLLDLDSLSAEVRKRFLAF